MCQADYSSEPPQTLAIIAGSHRGSEHPQMHQQPERGGHAGNHLSSPVIRIAYTSTGDQLGSNQLSKGRSSDKQEHYRANNITKWHGKHYPKAKI